MGGRIMVNGEYISEIYSWYKDNLLFVNRRYQRKLVWTLEEKQKFIDTILKGYPVPLFILVNTGDTVNVKGKHKDKKEIIDGLQRMEAIISFILNRYPVVIDGKEQYFNLGAYPGYAALISENKLHQEEPAMDLTMSNDFLLYQLPISITLDYNKLAVDDIFKRINSTGKKLSTQDLRQAGVVSRFSDLVRIIATHLRGDATDDIISLNEIADYSLSNHGLNYGLDIDQVFWVEQGIISTDSLRRSKDEEIVAILCNCILSDYSCGTSLSTLNKVYNENSGVFKDYEKTLSQEKCEMVIEIFQHVVADLHKIFDVSNTTFEQLLFKGEKNYNKDIVFIIVFSAFAQLYIENYYISDYGKMNNALLRIANRELQEIICTSSIIWNIGIRRHLIDRIKSILKQFMSIKEVNPEWNRAFKVFLKGLSSEKQMCDFKVGFHDLRTGKENIELMEKCVKTLVAMANTKPFKEGVIVIGICDKEEDAWDFENYYKTDVSKYNDYYITGVSDEAKRFYGSIQNFIQRIKGVVEKQGVAPEVIQYILTNIDTMRYGEQTLVIMRLKSNKPLFYNGEMFVRFDSHNKPIKVGSNEFYEVLNNFSNKGKEISTTQEVLKPLDFGG